MYNRVLLFGNTPSKSSHITHSKVVFNGFLVNPSRSLVTPELTDRGKGHTISISVLAKSSLWMFLKYFWMKLFASSFVNPTISHSVSQYLLTSLPVSWRAVRTMKQSESSLPWTRLKNIFRFLGSASSSPSRTKRTLDWFSRINLKKRFLAWSSISSGRSWSSIASQISDFISWHLRNSNTSISEKEESQSPCLVAQSYASFWQYVVFPIPGSPSIKTVRGFWHSACALKIAVILVISSVRPPWVFSLPTIFNLVKISFIWKLKSSNQGTGRRRFSRVL